MGLRTRIVSVVAITATVMAGGLFAATAGNAAAAVRIVGLANKCVDVRGANSADGTPVQLYDCNPSSAQQWTREGRTLRAYGKCLDIADKGTANGTKVLLWPCTGDGNQEWDSRGDGTLYNPRSNRCLDVPARDSSNGNQLAIWDCHAGANQQWKLGGGASCNYPNWQAGKSYVVGDIVKYTNGQYYKASHDNPGYDPVISTWFWDPYTCGNDPDPGPGSFPVSEAQFNQMFPNRNSFYTYAGLIDAASKFPRFAKTGSDTIRKREAAAWLANANHETGGLVHITEINKSNDLCDESQPYGCPAGTFGYYGRGPIQLSWNFNYNAAGNALGLPLLTNPYLVEQNASVAWQTGLWYWTTQNGPGTMTAHAAMVNDRGFGETIRSINGSLECDGRNPAQVASRVDAYKRFTGIIGVDPGGNLYC